MELYKAKKTTYMLGSSWPNDIIIGDLFNFQPSIHIGEKQRNIQLISTETIQFSSASAMRIHN